MTPSREARVDRPIARLVRTTRTFEGKQGLTYGEGVFAENSGAERLCMHLVHIPPGGRASAHLHADHESVIYLMRGAVTVLHGADLRQRDEMQPGDFIYIPANVPHLPVNESATEEAVAVLARSDPNEQESVVLLPELDGGGAGRLGS